MSKNSCYYLVPFLPTHSHAHSITHAHSIIPSPSQPKNNLLQRYQFDVDHLADIAQSLDKQELDIIKAASGPDSKDYRDRLREGSGNVDASGNFSIEVLRAALIPNDLTLVSVAGEHIRDSQVDLTVRTGFILNRHNHWFAIRLVNDVFWKLDSMKEVRGGERRDVCAVSPEHCARQV